VALLDWHEYCKGDQVGMGFANARMMPSVIILCWHEYCMGRVGIYIAYARMMPESWHGDCRGGGVVTLM
jgi:hypothetical protein